MVSGTKAIYEYVHINLQCQVRTSIYYTSFKSFYNHDVPKDKKACRLYIIYLFIYDDLFNLSLNMFCLSGVKIYHDKILGTKEAISIKFGVMSLNHKTQDCIRECFDLIKNNSILRFSLNIRLKSIFKRINDYIDLNQVSVFVCEKMSLDYHSQILSTSFDSFSSIIFCFISLVDIRAQLLLKIRRS